MCVMTVEAQGVMVIQSRDTCPDSEGQASFLKKGEVVLPGC